MAVFSQAARAVQALQGGWLLVTLVAGYALLVLANLAGHLYPDSWLSLVAGREIWQSGLPHSESLTAWAEGREWVNQQWLAHLALYGLQAVGGLKLALVVHAAVLVGTLALAIFAAKNLGGSQLATLAVFGVAWLTLIPTWQMRAQTLALPLFVGLVWLLAANARRSATRPHSTQVLLVFPLLAVWANVHGSVVLGAALAVLYALCTLRRSLLDASLLLAPLTVLASPYGLDLVGYYRLMLLDPPFAGLVREWAPAFPSLVSLPLYLLLLVVVLGLTRRRRLSGFEQLALVLLSVNSLLALRNMVWLALAALVLLPGLLTARGEDAGLWAKLAARGPRSPLSLRLLGPLAAAAAVVCVPIASLAWAGRPDEVDRAYPPAAAHAVWAAVSEKPTAVVFSHLDYADWLLWVEPRLKGRLTHDARLELLTKAEVQAASDWIHRRGDWQGAAGDVVVLSLPEERSTLLALLASNDAWRPLYRGPAVAVLARSTRS